ncbi:nitronate monooxygenase [Williamsia sp.]|uniref:NAD(P)H-dependent flavin oxidoreductase n=1 Tax=Williamsia sp. TaxID=1872085 RepID=UPI002F93F935
MSDMTPTRTALADIVTSLTLPVVAAPMTRVSGPEIVGAACTAGIIGSIPAHNAPSTAHLDTLLTDLEAELGERSRLVMPNIVVHRSNRRLAADIECLAAHRIGAVIASVGAPDVIIEPLQRAGIAVLADVATMRHAQRAARAGVDGLVLLTAGAGGQTGTANPFAFVRAVRQQFDGVVALAGGIADGRSILAAQVAGADLAYLGTRFLATRESRADADYQAAVVNADLDDVRLTTAVSGLRSSVLATWIEEHFDDNSGRSASTGFSHDVLTSTEPFAWSAGHAVAAVTAITGLAVVVDTLRAEYQRAADETRAFLTHSLPSTV